jgi:hypothetical protein
MKARDLLCAKNFCPVASWCDSTLRIGLHFLLLAKLCVYDGARTHFGHASVGAKSSQEKIFMCQQITQHAALTKLVNESENTKDCFDSKLNQVAFNFYVEIGEIYMNYCMECIFSYFFRS